MSRLSEPAFTCYEQPLNERTRTFLRLEHLFTQTEHHRADASEWGVRAAMSTLLDIFSILSRHDLRTECSKELSAQQATLRSLQNHQGVDHVRLAEILHQLDTLEQEIKRIPSQFAAYVLRDNDLLNAINNRNAIPGGTCGFDLPSYRFWLSRPSEVRQDNIQQWYRQLEPFRASIEVILKLLRDSTAAAQHTAEGGVLVYKTQSGTQLLRVLVSYHELVFPEISAGRHRCTVRFMEQSGADLRVCQTGRDIPFQMACCRL